MSTILFPAIQDGVLVSLTTEQVQAELGIVMVDKPVIDVPPIVVKPPVDLPVAPYSTLLGDLAGSIGENQVYDSADKACYYELEKGKLIPRGTNLPFNAATGHIRLTGNDCPTGAVGVPQRYTLPKGWGWAQFDDKAFYIVPKQTDNPGPDWLQPEASIPTNNSTKKSTDWDYDNTLN